MKTGKRILSLLLVAAMLLSIPITVSHAEETVEIQTNTLYDNGTQAPEAWGVTPSPNQYQYHKDELAAFCHFGMNTFTGSEWGSGTEDPSQFTLTQPFDAETLVKALKDAGFKKLLVTAKHHDGFCIWRSAYTDHDLESTNYTGDVLAEISAACTKYDIDMGLYLSPWDENAESYGYRDADGNASTPENDPLDYNEYYNNQLVEILSSDAYGNDGHFVEVWMDGAKGSGAMAQEYDFERWFATIQQYEGKAAGFEDDCMLFGAEAYTSVHWIGNELGFANEETWAKIQVDKETNYFSSNLQSGYAIGYPEGNAWSVPESDARITSGWFWGSNKNTPKSVAELGEMYFRSVGHNSPLLLNVPPNADGTVDEAILTRLDEFGDAIAQTFAFNYASDAVISASSVRGNDIRFAPSNVLDGDDTTYWTPDADSTTGTLELDLGQAVYFDVVSIEESIELGQRISGFSVEYQLNGGEWKTFDEGTTIGAKRLCRQGLVRADKIRINITSSYAVPLINEVGIYRAAGDFAVTNGIPEGLEIIDNTDTDLSDGAGFTYTGWNQETGDSFLNGTNMWANAGAEATVTFSGTKAWVVGTTDPNHGTADVYIDGVKQDVGMDTYASQRSLGQYIYETPDLEDGEHTLRIVNTYKAIGIEGLLVLNNGGKGMLELEYDQYTVPEDTVNSFVIRRVGGSTGEVSVSFEDNPGSAVQSEFLPTNGIVVTFADGETEKTVQVTTKRQTAQTGDLSFYIGLVNPTDGAILGFTSLARVTILDTESLTQDAPYTQDNRFVFPDTVGQEKDLEAEHFQLNNSGDNEQWPLTVRESSWASNGKYVDALNANDSITLYYTASKAGIYSAVVTYRSGDTRNALVWEEASGKITAGQAQVGASDAAAATHTTTLEFVVTEVGDGALTFTGPEYNSPQLDKFIITLTEATCTHENTEAIGEAREATCIHTGITAGVKCADCGEILTAQEETPALGHDYVDGVCTRCGKLLGVVRLAGSHRWNTALKVADEMKANLDVEKFDAIIIASGNGFADALAGSYLSTVKSAPILLSWGNGGKFEYLDTDNIDYIKENLSEDGVVYLLGGTSAVPELYETELSDYEVKRLGGKDRFETNLMILEEAGVAAGSEILVCTSTNFADSLSASATGKPILLVFNESGKLYGDQPEYLAGLENCTFTVIGGESAVSEELAAAAGEYGDVERLAGGNRFETSVLVAEKYFEAPETAVLAYAWNYPDGLCGGALAYSMGAPLILTMTGYEAQAVAYAESVGLTTGIVLGGDSLISDAAVRAIFAMEAETEIIVK